jgi:hypothetical protein
LKIKVTVHEAEEDGFWGEVPAIPGCASQDETMDELLRNLHLVSIRPIFVSAGIALIWIASSLRSSQ